MKEKWYKQMWLWLMLISLALIVLFLIEIIKICPNPNIICAFENQAFWDAIGAVGTIFAFVYAIYTYKQNVKWKRKENTLQAFNALQEQVFDTQTLNLTLDESDALVQRQSQAHADAENWVKITECLCRIEHFAVGINTGIYDLETINRMAGNFLIEKYDSLKPIIVYKKDVAHKGQNYMEFLKMVNAIIDLRNEQPAIYDHEKHRS
jgi:hypothetical protein